jgi:antitoxin (DNA-binding transcriptional repressor) of toxin-antitoxin stability system
MMTKTVDVHDPQLQLDELLSMVEQGVEVILTDGDTPLARLVPMNLVAGERVAGLNPGAIWTSDDFDDPLPDEFWAGTL